MSKISPKAKKIWRPIYEVIHASFFEETNIFPKPFLELCKNNPNQPQFIPSDVKIVLKKNGYGTRVICTSGHDPPKRLE